MDTQTKAVAVFCTSTLVFLAVQVLRGVAERGPIFALIPLGILFLGGIAIGKIVIA